MNYNTLKSIFFKLEPETAHKVAEKTLSISDCVFPGLYSAVAKNCIVTDTALSQNLLGASFLNPVGIAGGFDKNATMVRPLAALGFGHVEFGTVTPKAQEGNAKPRLFRLIEEESIQNAMGFNNEGEGAVSARIGRLYPFAIPLFANIGKNKITPNEEAIKDYENLVVKFNEICDCFVINVSSPNTPNLRELQEESFIKELFARLLPIAKKPIIFKIAPDMAESKAVQICKTAVESGAKGVIVNNTSIDYSLSKSANLQNFGGLSGKVIAKRSRELFKAVASELYGKTVLIASGGIDSAEEAYARIKSGANLVQIYTSFIFKGPSIAKRINEGILKLLKEDNFASIGEAVGCEIKNKI
ncbi:quinone-dependent dihydroorotate dehydrogenase [Campylobacter rectus]|uniref:quinone-dependent dihydroorotate dehydrogenase n=1 Tax=Campylobacter rectus TaxID=203 RepID=UPI000F5E0440|nr:quinone-dependent dihydroorotate dehydrogenase [Campylobacter rectus]RRD54057.1 quinone-dependent dihydroorotate dehydrogenase [Campylobacter rectus]